LNSPSMSAFPILLIPFPPPLTDRIDQRISHPLIQHPLPPDFFETRESSGRRVPFLFFLCGIPRVSYSFRYYPAQWAATFSPLRDPPFRPPPSFFFPSPSFFFLLEIYSELRPVDRGSVAKVGPRSGCRFSLKSILTALVIPPPT